VGQWTWRTNPQIWQLAVWPSGASSSRLGQPFVLQNSRVEAVRRRMRRIAEARPVTDDVVDRFIIGVFVCAFWRAVIA
jgi:hypothetical protein